MQPVVASHRLSQPSWEEFIASKLADYQPLDAEGWEGFQSHSPNGEWDAVNLRILILACERPEVHKRYKALIPRPTIKIERPVIVARTDPI